MTQKFIFSKPGPTYLPRSQTKNRKFLSIIELHKWNLICHICRTAQEEEKSRIPRCTVRVRVLAGKRRRTRLLNWQAGLCLESARQWRRLSQGDGSKAFYHSLGFKYAFRYLESLRCYFSSSVTCQQLKFNLITSLGTVTNSN